MRTALQVILLGLGGLAAALPSHTAQAASIRQTTRYFMVRGATLAEIDRDLNRQGPFIAQTGLRHPGATEVKFDGQITYKRLGTRCAVDQTRIGLKLDILLPRWNAPRNASPATRLVWKTLAADIERHEREHAAIAKNWLKRLEMALRNLQPERDCRTMEAMVNYVTDRYLSNHQEAQLRFDEKEGREVNIRLQRALSHSLAADASR